MTRDPEPPHAPQGDPPGEQGPRPARLQRVGTVLILILLLGGIGLAARALSKKYAPEVSVPGTYVKIRPEAGGIVEARALPARTRAQAPGPVGATISMEVELADVASLVGLMAEVSKTRIVLLQPVARRVSLRVRDAPVESALEALASAVNLTLSWRDGAFVLGGCAPGGG